MWQYFFFNFGNWLYYDVNLSMACLYRIWHASSKFLWDNTLQRPMWLFFKWKKIIHFIMNLQITPTQWQMDFCLPKELPSSFCTVFIILAPFKNFFFSRFQVSRTNLFSDNQLTLTPLSWVTYLHWDLENERQHLTSHLRFLDLGHWAFRG